MLMSCLTTCSIPPSDTCRKMGGLPVSESSMTCAHSVSPFGVDVPGYWNVSVTASDRMPTSSRHDLDHDTGAQSKQAAASRHRMSILFPDPGRSLRRTSPLVGVFGINCKNLRVCLFFVIHSTLWVGGPILFEPREMHLEWHSSVRVGPFSHCAA
jgi:hypothetical protein